MTRRLRLGVNIDHVATIRNARGGTHPEPLRAAEAAIAAGADGITAHLREDRRHISDADIEQLSAACARLGRPLNFEMAVTDEMRDIALRHRPHAACIVPEDGAPLEEGELPAAIDAMAFSTLEKSVGVKTLIEILQCYIVTAEELTNALAQACAEEKWDEAARLAQDIVGAAGGLGLGAVTQAARLFAQKSREGHNPHDLRNAAQMVVGEHVRARRALHNLYPDVA